MGDASQGWPLGLLAVAQRRSRREDYVKQLQEHVRVDVYGKCGHLKCPRANSTKCYEMFAKKYFFYLSFENSICRDYVTEKLFNVLKYDIIPCGPRWSQLHSHCPSGFVH
ncbi:hypothetical protein HPB48_026902 [Haemaphysalis longicornis]|uniref:Fucosyltransferase n=1 Tax=Haemaphysalis longicornis TaxID=44386 RepID=A0A9J6HDC4_HAELO|nr:hypothetical protein HPB48_026902 [Haemaphysalis longicornis]